MDEQLEFITIENDASDENLIKLIKLKNIFRKQLPKMPGEYIVRLVMDRKHKSMIALKGSIIIGGVCFRYFPGKNFSEIAFLAISYSEQVRGYGTQLMNHLKNHVLAKGIRYFLTYADNFALGYFRKQGFNSEVEPVLREKFWRGYIKDYDGGTLMVCKLEPGVDYTKIHSVIKQQHSFATSVIEQISPHTEIRQPNAVLLENGNCCYTDVEGLSEVDYHPGQNIPTTEEEKDAKEACFNFIIEQMMSDSSSWPFREPVGTEVAPDYYEIIKDPVDLTTMKRRVCAGDYCAIDKFVLDVEKIFNNCRIYNKKDTVYFKMADKLEQFINPFLEQLKSSLISS